MKTTWYKSGDWNAICDVCGFKFKASELKLRWDGLMVCKDDFETRHPQDLVREIKEDTSVSWTRPEAADAYIDVDFTTTGCTIEGSSSTPNFAVPDCAVPDTIRQGLI